MRKKIITVGLGTFTRPLVVGVAFHVLVATGNHNKDHGSVII